MLRQKVAHTDVAHNAAFSSFDQRPPGLDVEIEPGQRPMDQVKVDPVQAGPVDALGDRVDCFVILLVAVPAASR
jgi:hypothetical protein